jgi:hypothetical protein
VGATAPRAYASSASAVGTASSRIEPPLIHGMPDSARRSADTELPLEDVAEEIAMQVAVRKRLPDHRSAPDIRAGTLPVPQEGL